MADLQDEPDIREWFRSFRKRAVPILSGGVAILVGLWQSWEGKSLSWNISFTIAVMCGFWASYLAWKDKAIELKKSKQEHAKDTFDWRRERDKEARRIAEISRRKKIEEDLVELLNLIAARRVAIKQLGGMYYDTKMSKAKDQQDKESMEVIGKTHMYLITNLGQTEADLWMLTSGFQPMVETTGSARYDKMLHFLTQYEIKLKAIIEKYRPQVAPL